MHGTRNVKLLQNWQLDKKYSCLMGYVQCEIIFVQKDQ